MSGAAKDPTIYVEDCEKGVLPKLEVIVPNASYLADYDKEAFAKARRAGLGASDSSIILGVNKWTSVEQLIEQKASPEITAEEYETGMKVNVRKGADLEELVRKKAENFLNHAILKPQPMFRIKDYPWLTVNYDGILTVNLQPIPVECKWVSQYACKFWDTSKALNTPIDGFKVTSGNSHSLKDYIADMSRLTGIPGYYYTQVQQQMLGLDAPYAYLAALHDVDWELYVFKIYRDQYVIDQLLLKSKEVWDIIQERKG